MSAYRGRDCGFRGLCAVRPRGWQDGHTAIVSGEGTAAEAAAAAGVEQRGTYGGSARVLQQQTGAKFRGLVMDPAGALVVRSARRQDALT